MKDVFAVITDAIIEDLNKGVIPWRRPWTVGARGCFSYATGKAYSLLNTLLLGAKGGDYITYKGAQKAGGNVKRGEKAKTVVFWNMIKKTKEDGGEEIIPILRAYNVFHISQCDGLTPRHKDAELFETAPIEKAESIIRAYVEREGITLDIGDYDEAYYTPTTDVVHLPRIERYADASEYYSTSFHELIHSTAVKARLNRLEKGSTGAYAREELVAELGSAFIMNACGIDTTDTFENSEAYIQGWLQALKNDKRLIVTAAGRADKAVARILGITAEAEEAEVE